LVSRLSPRVLGKFAEILQGSPLNLRSFTAVFFGRCAMTEYYINTYIKTSSWRQTGGFCIVPQKDSMV
jgi:hypothetical protein